MKRLTLLIYVAALFIACETEKDKKEEPVVCPAIACYQVFSSVNVKFTDAQGAPVILKNYSSVNLRTKDTLAKGAAIDLVDATGFYLVANDSHTKTLSEQGDTIVVKGIHPGLNQNIKGTFVVKGGQCACHIEKLSGPAELKFN